MSVALFALGISMRLMWSDHNLSANYMTIAGCDGLCVATIDCIKEMDLTSVTSPIGLWPAVRKATVLNLGSAILKISGACREKKICISRTLVNQPVNQDVATP